MRSLDKKIILCIVCFFLFASISEAWLPPEVSIESAFEKGNVAFSGRIVNIKEIDYDKFYSDASAEVKVLKTFFGTDLRPGDIVTVKYYGRAYFDYPNPCFGIDLNISDHVLFVFVGDSMKDRNTYRFTSCYGKYTKDMDYAYVYKDDPDDDINDAELMLSLISGWWKGTVDKDNLDIWAAAKGAGDSGVPDNLRENRSYRYDCPKVDLIGVVMEKMFYGPPGYGENPEEDLKELVYILKLIEPIDVIAEEIEELLDTHRNVTEVQIANLKKLDLDLYKNTTVTARGKLFSSHVGHHHTKVLIELEAISAE